MLLGRELIRAVLDGLKAEKCEGVTQTQCILKELCKELDCSQAGITRAKKCFQQGFDPCRIGRHKKLNDADEEILVSWILDLLDEGETLYSPKIIEMV